MMKGQLLYTRGTFEDVFEEIGDKVDGSMGKWLKELGKRLYQKEGKSFEDIWETSIKQELKDSCLKQEELDELLRLGKNISHFENIDLFIEQLEYKIQTTREAYVTKGKLYKSFGIMGGVFLVILLL